MMPAIRRPEWNERAGTCRRGYRRLGTAPGWIACHAVLFGALGVTPAVVAQSPAQRERIESFRDSIGPVKDSVALLALEKKLIAHASHEARDSAMVHLELGFVALRLGDLNGRKHYEDAASEFQWVVDLQSKWPYGWLGLGFAELGVGDAEFSLLRGLQSALGKDALTRSANDFAKSAEVDPGFVRGLVELSNTALRQRVNLRLGVALAALRRAARTPAARNPEVLLARARLEREVGSPDSALVAVDSLVAHDPTGPVTLLEEARTLFRLGRVSGVEPWYRGLASADPAALALYRSDLLFVLPDSTLHAFDTTPGAARAALMRRFWDVRDHDELRSPGERLVEHYRRLDYARHNYRLASTHRHYDIVERYRPPVADFDDRGVIYIRQGTPDDRASLEAPGLAFNESWVYHRKDTGDLLFHFVGREGVADFRLVESALDVLGYRNAVRLENSGDVQGTDGPMMPPSRTRINRIGADSAALLRQRASDAAMSMQAEAILRSRERLSPIYRRLLTSGKGGASGLEAEERALGSRSIRIGTTTDRWPRGYAVALPAAAVALATGGDSVTSVLHLAYAIPVSALQAAARGDSATGWLHVRASVLGFDGTVVAVLDTMVASRPDAVRVARDQALGMATIKVPPGRFTARVALEAGRAGVVGPRDTINVISPTSTSLAMSDLALGTRSIALSWVAGAGDTVWVNPRGQFRSAEPMQLYFEVSGVPRDTAYHVELAVKRPGGESLLHRLFGLFGGGGGATRVTFAERSRDGRDFIHREISLEKLKPAVYVLEVTVATPAGKKLVRRQDFTVIQ